MVSRRREEENRAILESERAMSDITEDDRANMFCINCMIATSLRKCPRCRAETALME
jgi:hypothetical protein